MVVQLNGLVIKEQSGFYWVEAEDHRTYTCRLRGKLKEEAQSSDIASIGDRVTISPIKEDGVDGYSGIIEEVHERHTVISRAVRTTGKRGAGQAEREHILIANPDQACFVFAATQPTPNWHMLDRLLVTGERAEVEHLLIIINKVDVADMAQLEQDLLPYRTMGYNVLFTSAKQNIGLDALKEHLRDKITVFTGPSGVGKTSLLNQMQPGLGRAVKTVSEFSQEGMHTTRDSALVRLDIGGYLADTPGIRQISVWDVEPDELDAYFLDIRDLVGLCKFRNCTHIHEPGCAVLSAIKIGDLHQRRYDHYIELRDELRDTYIVY